MSEYNLILKNLSSITAWQSVSSDDTSGIYGIVHTSEDATNVIREYEKLTVSQYVSSGRHGSMQDDKIKGEPMVNKALVSLICSECVKGGSPGHNL